MSQSQYPCGVQGCYRFSSAALLVDHWDLLRELLLTQEGINEVIAWLGSNASF
jgi:hypothetical protein